MADMNELLEKYFKGETSLQEENLLKLYFRSGQVKAGHEIYRSMFDAFEEESQVVMPAPKRKVIDLKQPKLKRIGWQSISISGIAAIVLLAFWFSAPNLSMPIMQLFTVNASTTPLMHSKWL